MSKLVVWFLFYKDIKDWLGNNLYLFEFVIISMIRQVGVIGQCIFIDSIVKLDYYILLFLGLVGDYVMFCFLNVIELVNIIFVNGVLGCYDYNMNSGIGIMLKFFVNNIYLILVNIGSGFFGCIYNIYCGLLRLNLNIWYYVGFIWE